jgi:hypothetical protein
MWAEMCDDLKQGRWRDAIFGREAWRKSIYVGKEVKAQHGDELARLKLPIYRWSLGVINEERVLWAAEAAAVCAQQDSQ